MATAPAQQQQALPATVDAGPSGARRLNGKRETFARLVAEGLDARRAYVDAGYRATSSVAETRNANKMLADPLVKARVAFIRRGLALSAGVDMRQVMEELAALAFSNMADFIDLSSPDNPRVDLSGITRKQAAAIREITTETYVDGHGEDAREVRRVRLKLYDKLGPLKEMLAHLRALQKEEDARAAAAEAAGTPTPGTPHAFNGDGSHTGLNPSDEPLRKRLIEEIRRMIRDAAATDVARQSPAVVEAVRDVDDAGGGEVVGASEALEEVAGEE